MGVDVILGLMDVHVLRGKGDVGGTALGLVGIIGDHRFVWILLQARQQVGSPEGRNRDTVFKGYAPDGDGGKTDGEISCSYLFLLLKAGKGQRNPWMPTFTSL